MLKTSSFKKGLAVLVAIAVIVLLFPGVTHTSNESSAPKTPLIKKFVSSFSSIFPLFNFKFFVMGTDKDKKEKDPYGDNDNSTSKRRANGKDCK